MKGVYENLLKQGFDESVLNKIFYNNAKRFFDKNLKWYKNNSTSFEVELNHLINQLLTVKQTSWCF